MKKILIQVVKKLGLFEFLDKLYVKIFAKERIRTFIERGGSSSYWEERYSNGGNSGAGSYNRLAEFKADTVNQFLMEHPEIDSCIEWGCGDGNQLGLIKYKRYVGVDVSPTAVNMCRQKYKDDKSKDFYELDWYYENKKDMKYDMSVSLDVIFHLIEDGVFETYMDNLFDSSRKYVCIYSNNYEDEYYGGHQKNRKFTEWIVHRRKNWELVKFVKQKYPYDPKVKNGIDTSISDFYFFREVTLPKT